MSETSRILLVSLSIALISGCGGAGNVPSAGGVSKKHMSYAIFNRKELDAQLQEGQLSSLPIAFDRTEKGVFVEIREYKADFDARRDPPEGNDTSIYVRCENLGENQKTYTFFSGYYGDAGAELVWDADVKEFWVRGWKCRFDSNGKTIGSEVRCQDLEPCQFKVEGDEIRVLFCNW